MSAIADKPWSERLIARAISTQLLNRRCIVLLENTTWTGHETDLLGVTMDRRLIDVEVKISRADLRRDRWKEKWWHDLHFACEGPRLLRGHPPKVWKHYYAVPQEIWKPELANDLPSPNSGILLLRQGRHEGETPVIVNCMRRAVPDRECDRISAEDCLDIARLTNIRMWEAFKELECRA